MKTYIQQATAILSNKSKARVEGKGLVELPEVFFIYKDSKGIYSKIDGEKWYIENWTVSDDYQIQEC